MASFQLSISNIFCFYLRFFEGHTPAKASKVKENYVEGAGDFNNNVPNMQVFSLANIEAATNNFSIENKLGEGGYGPVYKVIKHLQILKIKF